MATGVLPSWIGIDEQRILLNSKMTAEFFGVTERALLEWVKRGCPKESRGWYDIKAVMEWRGSTTGPKAAELSAEARKIAAEAKFKEAKAAMAVMDQAVMEGKYIEKAEVDRTWATVGTQLKANIMAWVRTLTPVLAHQDMRSVEKVMTGAVYDLLEQLSSKGHYQKARKKAT
jgi:phage terminase Nu1 subunit (DNA packaging protein)